MSPPNVAVIGAGLAGLSAAYYLQKQGFSVTVFEKKLNIGGRLGCFSDVELEVDTGAQYFTVRSPVTQLLLDKWIKQGLVQRWNPKIKVIGQRTKDVHAVVNHLVERWVAQPTMAALMQFFVEDVDLRCQHEVSQLIKINANQWQLQFTDESVSEDVFDRVLCALPAPIVTQLVSTLQPSWLPLLDKVVFLPTQGALLNFVEQPDFDAAFINQGSLRWLANNSSKPGRRAGLPWTLHFDQQWSVINSAIGIDDFISFVIKQWRELNQPSEIRDIMPFSWQHAISLNQALPSSLWDNALRLGAVGDWQMGGRVEGAILSGYHLSQRLQQG
ncbi:FAD-dependent oxidoreductase [Ferrovum sp. PN-J185]|uniref:NAD(P)/FAD-dependent oxidoreductase n=1 Tax=Ferrovum sp. PN-J185 TaxID=1356306 RepID=UPI001E3EAA33|nr:FAD-dependent oxidoreductase [Ferrovum sp. PN-J185]MCC6068130.1 FAD-dependent oxidoreductase [Ferrovum sp. PN-J185]MDE1891757.1 FAD-dependent oxidoreductase [Betaproteobacteria bacterium]MDE2056401.1 FAD-dependent oxidoreductase [Betaproteobacteria bacterium]